MKKKIDQNRNIITRFHLYARELFLAHRFMVLVNISSGNSTTSKEIVDEAREHIANLFVPNIWSVLP